MVTLIVVSKDWERLGPCLSGLGQQSLSDFRVIMLDFDSNHSVSKQVESSILFREGRVDVISAEGTTINQARNRGLDLIDESEKEKPKYVGFLDDESRPEPDWLENLVNAAEHADEKTGMFASIVLGKCQCHLRSAGHTLVPWGRPDRAHRLTLSMELPLGQPLCPCHAGALFRWSLIRQVSGYEPFIDEEIEHYWSCFDPGIKAGILGWSCALVKDAVVVDAGFDAHTDDRPTCPSDKAMRLMQESRLALTLKYVPCEQLPDALISQLAGNAAGILKLGKGTVLAEAFENIKFKRESLLRKRRMWAQIAADRGTSTIMLGG